VLCNIQFVTPAKARGNGYIPKDLSARHFFRFLAMLPPPCGQPCLIPVAVRGRYEAPKKSRNSAHFFKALFHHNELQIGAMGTEGMDCLQDFRGSFVNAAASLLTFMV